VNVTAAAVTVTITSIVPAAGKSTGNKSVTINGSGFQPGATVTFGGSAATNVVVINSTTITATTPAHAAGAVNVTVTNPDASTATLTNGYTFLITQFDPNGDTVVDPADIFYLVNYLFLSGPPPIGAAGLLSGDANGDDAVDPSDIFYAVSYLFINGPAPASQPSRVSTQRLPESLAGTVSLGRPVMRGNRFVIPVSVTAEPGSQLPGALALRLLFNGGSVSDAVIHRTGNVEPAFEISRRTSNTLMYMLAVDERKGAIAGVIAEIEIEPRAGANMTVAIDPKLTMIGNQGGTRSATVAAGTLRVSGTTIEAEPRQLPQREWSRP
jgi:hypothetical protein